MPLFYVFTCALGFYAVNVAARNGKPTNVLVAKADAFAGVFPLMVGEMWIRFGVRYRKFRRAGLTPPAAMRRLAG